MTKILNFDDVELGDDLPTETPDVSMERVTNFCQAAKHCLLYTSPSPRD